MFGWLFGKKKEKKITKRKYLSKNLTKRRKDFSGTEMVYHAPTNEWLYWYMISEYVYDDNEELVTEVPEVLVEVEEEIYSYEPPVEEPSPSFSDVNTTSSYSNEGTSSPYSSPSDSSSSSSSYDSSSDW